MRIFIIYKEKYKDTLTYEKAVEKIEKFFLLTAYDVKVRKGYSKTIFGVVFRQEINQSKDWL